MDSAVFATVHLPLKIHDKQPAHDYFLSTDWPDKHIFKLDRPPTTNVSIKEFLKQSSGYWILDTLAESQELGLENDE